MKLNARLSLDPQGLSTADLNAAAAASGEIYNNDDAGLRSKLPDEAMAETHDIFNDVDGQQRDAQRRREVRRG